MKKQWMASLALAFCLITAGYAQQPTQTTSNGNLNSSTQRNTSSRTGLDRKGGVEVGREGSEKMKSGVSRSGNSNLSPTSPSNVPPPGGDKPASPAAKTGTSAGAVAKPPKSVTPAKPKGTGTSNGNTSASRITPVQTQGSTSEGTASMAAPGGAPGTNMKTTRSVQPKSRAAEMSKNDAKQQASAAGQANSAKKTGSNGQTSPGATPVTVTERGQKDGSYSDAAKRNKTANGPSKDPLKTGPNGQQTKAQQ